MKKQNYFLALLLILGAWPGAGISQAASPLAVLAWGNNGSGQTTVPVAAQSGVTAIAAGYGHTVALKSNGGVIAWGVGSYDNYGQTNVPVAAQTGMTAIAAGEYHSVALKNDGSVVAWGNNGSGQTTVPVEAQSGVMAIAAGGNHTVALKTKGSVLAWGSNYEGQTTVPVAAQSGVTAIAAGRFHTMALKNDGSVVAWGNNAYGQTTVPVAAQSGVAAIAAGEEHNVALKTNGSVVAWGRNYEGQTTVPVAAQNGVMAIAAGGNHTVGLKTNGSVVAWGNNNSGQTTVPVAAQSDVMAIAAGYSHTVALITTTAPTITTQPLSQTVNVGQSASFTVTATGIYLSYQWRKDGVDLAGATSATYSLGLAQTNQAGSYTVVVSNSLGSVTSAPPAVLTVNAALTVVFTNTDGITIPVIGPATPYPSIITVAGISGSVSALRVGIVGFTHTFPLDVKVCLMAPNGNVATLMGSVGGSFAVSNIDLSFDDEAATALARYNEIVPGNYHPADDGIGTNLKALTDGEVNGDWKLLVWDGTDEDGGSIQSWALILQWLSPKLEVRRSAGSLTVQWPTNAVGFTLQSTPSLTPPVTWIDSTNPPAVIGGQFTVTIPFSSGAKFFRLRKL